MKVSEVEVSQQHEKDFNTNGYIHIPNVLGMKEIERLRNRFEALFDGQFDTGVYPDEWHWRKGLSKDNCFREMVNAWKSDTTIRSLVLSKALGKVACRLMKWKGARIGQDDILWKVAGSSGVGYHRDSSYISKQFEPYENNSITIWVALDNADSESGVVEYVKGSHKDYKVRDFSKSFFTSESMESVKHDSIVTHKIAAGDILCHHQDILHGSGPNRTTTKHRRAIGIHYVREDVRWSTTFTPDYIYGRYVIEGETTPRDDFFPVVYQEKGASKL